MLVEKAIDKLYQQFMTGKNSRHFCADTCRHMGVVPLSLDTTIIGRCPLVANFGDISTSIVLD